MSKSSSIPKNVQLLGDNSFVFTDRSHGNMSLQVGDTSQALDNRNQILRTLPKGRRNVAIRSQHAANVQCSDRDQPTDIDTLGFEYFDCDALIVNPQTTSAWIFPADCICLVLYSDASPYACLVHISRVTLESKLLENAVKEYMKYCGIHVRSIRAFLSPHVQAISYVFPDNIYKKLFDHSWDKYINILPNNTVSIDLTKRTLTELNNLGISSTKIKKSPINTANGNYYSQSRGHDIEHLRGRNAAILYSNH